MSGNERTARPFLRRRCRSVVLGLVLSAVAVAAPPVAFAQPASAKPKPKPEELKAYTLPYFFAIVGVLAILSPLCMPVKRKWDLPNQTEE